MYRKIVALIISVQLINVQTQIAYGNTEVIKSTHEYQSLMDLVQNRLEAKLDGKSDQELSGMGYRVYKLGVHARNKISRWSEGKFERKLGKALNRSSEVISEEAEVLNRDEKEGLSELSAITGSSQAAMPANVDVSKVSKSDFIAQADQLLISLGSETQENGKLSVADSETFSNSLQMKTSQIKKSELRSPASNRALTRLLVGILVIIGAMTVLSYALSLLFYPILIIGLIVCVSWGIVSITIRI